MIIYIITGILSAALRLYSEVWKGVFSMQAMINKIGTNEVDNNYYNQNYMTKNTQSSSDSTADYEQMVFNSAGKDVLFNGPINNPLSDPENRLALQELVASEINSEFQGMDNGSEDYQPLADTGFANGTDEDYQPVFPGADSGEEEYQPVLVGTGSGESEEYQPVFVGTGSGESEEYQPVLVGTGSGENKEYQPVLVGTGSGENKEYQPVLVGTGSGKAENSMEKDAHEIDGISHAKSADKKHHVKDAVKTAEEKADKKPEIKRSHKPVRIAKHHKRVSRRAIVRSPIKNMRRQMEQNIKESIINNKNRSRELENDFYKNENARSLPDDTYVPKHVDDDINCPCPTCQNRRFVDRSGDLGVSFKSPQKMNAATALLSIRAHEGEHVAAENIKAFQQKQAIVHQSVTISMRYCPTCGSRYAAGGVTRTVTKLRADVAYKKAMESIKKRA